MVIMATDSFTLNEWRRMMGLMRTNKGNIPEGIVALAGNVDFVWDDGMTVDNGMMGKFYPINKIHLPMRFRYNMAELPLLLPTVAHEVVHYRQYMEKGMYKWALANCPLWRRWTIEPEAVAMEKMVEKNLGYHFMD
jgi:hypothetical protein